MEEGQRCAQADVAVLKQRVRRNAAPHFFLIAQLRPGCAGHDARRGEQAREWPQGKRQDAVEEGDVAPERRRVECEALQHSNKIGPTPRRIGCEDAVTSRPSAGALSARPCTE